MENQTVEIPDVIEKLADSLTAFNDKYTVAPFDARPLCIPGIGDVFLRHVTTLGYKGEYPRPYDWENLIPQLREGEELLWIVRKRGGADIASANRQAGVNGRFAFEIYIGLKFTGNPPVSKEAWEDRGRRFLSLTRHFAKSAFPETQLNHDMCDFEVTEFLNEISKMKHGYIVTGMPSDKAADLKDVSVRRDDKARPYAGLNDFLEMHGGPEDNFAIVFSVSRVSDARIQRDFDALFTLQNIIQPLLKEVVQYSDSTSTGWSITETATTSESSTDQIDGGERQYKKQRGLIPRVGRGLANIARWIGGTWGGEDQYDTKNLTELENQKLVMKIGVSKQHSTSTAVAKGNTQSEQHSRSYSVTTVNARFAYADERIKDTIKQLTQTLGTGGYSCGVVVYADRQFAAESLSGAICATMSGGHSALHPMKVYSIERPENRDWLVRRKSLSTVMEEEGVQSGVLNCEKACLYLPVPSTHLVGLPIKKNVFYGKERDPDYVPDGVDIGSMAFSEAHIKNEHTRQLIDADAHLQMQIFPNDFYSHLFIVGTTGCGKTTRAAKILRDAVQFRRIILETAKKTYWKELGLQPESLLVYTLGDSTKNPFRFNPFFFEDGANLKQHISVLSDAIADLLPMSALIGPKLREAVERCYRICGWDLESSTWTQTECLLKYPDVTMFNLVVRQIAEEMSDYSAETQGDYKGALFNRSAIFMGGIYQDIFAFDGNKTIDEMFPKDKTVIVEMEELPPSEINMPAFILSILLHRLRTYQNRASKVGTLTTTPGFLVAIEEAHNVLSRAIHDKGDEQQSGKGGHLVKQVTRLLAEGRGLRIGLMIIDQSAANIAPSVITNSNAKLVFRQEDGTEIETIGKAIGLKEDTWNDLQLLGQGECLLRNSRYPQPIKLARLRGDQRFDSHEITRGSFVADAAWIPPYQIGKRLIASFCRELGMIPDDNGGMKFAGLQGEAYELVIRKALTEICHHNVELVRYIETKTLMELGYFSDAEKIIGVKK